MNYRMIWQILGRVLLIEAALLLASRRLSCLRQFFGFLLVEHHRPDNPALGLDSPRQGRPLPRVLSEEEREAGLEPW